MLGLLDRSRAVVETIHVICRLGETLPSLWRFQLKSWQRRALAAFSLQGL